MSLERKYEKLIKSFRRVITKEINNVVFRICGKGEHPVLAVKKGH